VGGWLLVVLRVLYVAFAYRVRLSTFILVTSTVHMLLLLDLSGLLFCVCGSKVEVEIELS
jgi:hypothetical protein